MFFKKSTAKISPLFLFLILLVEAFFFPPVGANLALSQEIGEIGTASVLIEIEPSFPKSNENVLVRLTSYSGDLDRARISWSLDGKLMKDDTGGKEFTFKTGAVGKPTVVKVTVDGPGIGRFEKNITLSPAEVDILWQTTDSYSPPFYRGKPLPVRMSSIRAVAMPSMKTKSGLPIKSGELVYKWERDDIPILENSGYAKNSADFNLGYISEDATIKVSASSVKESGLVAENTVYLQAVSPEIIFYENKPLGGIIYENALKDLFPLRREEVEIVAEPYYFTSAGGLSSLSYNWVLNGAHVESSGGNSIVLRVGDQGSGLSEVSLNIKHPSRFLQMARKELGIQFGR